MILVAEDIGENIITDIANYLKQCFPDSFVEFTEMQHDFTLNPYTRTAKDKNDNEIFLTAKEFDLLYFLISHKGQVFTKEQIYENVWGASTPDIETLKRISMEFNVSIHTLLGSPGKLICQCCGMPLEDESTISRETDGSFNEDYCKWCYTDGKFVYHTMDELLDFLADHMSRGGFTPEQIRTYFSEQLLKLKHWK